MNLHDAQKQIRILTQAGNAVLLEGGSGLGKSAIAIAEFERIKAQEPTVSWGLGTVFAATQTPPDLIGFQFKGEKDFGDGKRITVTEPSCPLWMLSIPHGDDPGGKPAWMYDKFWLIIEEYGQGEADVKRAMAEIFLNGGTAPWYLPSGSVRIGCTNMGSRYGVTKDFDFCIARRSRLNIIGDINVLLPYLDKPYERHGRIWQTMPVIKSWAATHPEIVFEPEPKEQGPWCMPRTLCDADRYLQCVMAENGGQIPTDGGTLETLAGIIGMPATQSLVGHLQFRLELPSYDEIVADPSNTPVPTKADLLLLMAYELAGYTKVEHLTECITYMQRMPKDMAVTYVSALLRRDYKGLINQPAMQGWINKNASLVSIIASLSQ